MPLYVAPAKADYAFLFRQLTKSLGVADINFPEGDQVAPNAPYTKQQLRSQLVQSDVEVQALIASVEDHPFRSTYFITDPVEVLDNVFIPGYIGVHGGVEVHTSGKWLRGNLAQSLEHLDRVKDKLSIGADHIPESSYKIYFIHNGKAYFIAAMFRITLPTITAGDDTVETPELGTPLTSQYAVLAHAITMLRPVGANTQHRQDWQTIWSGYLQMITAGRSSLPEPERMQRNSE